MGTSGRRKADTRRARGGLVTTLGVAVGAITKRGRDGVGQLHLRWDEKPEKGHPKSQRRRAVWMKRHWPAGR